MQHCVRFKKMESKFTKITERSPAPACPSPSRPPSYLKAQPSLWTLSVKFSINPASCSSVHHLSPYFTCLKPKKILTHFQEQVGWGNWLPVTTRLPRSSITGVHLVHHFRPVALEFVPFYKSPLCANHQTESCLSTWNHLSWEETIFQFDMRKQSNTPSSGIPNKQFCQ